MGFLPPELLKKKQKLIRAAHQYKNMEANLANMKKSTEIIRYVIKYLNRYPAQFKDVFCAWLDFIKDFILRSDQSLQINTLTQISIILMYVLRIKFNPICLIEDILGAWIDLLVVVPIEVTSVIVIRNHSKIHSIINSLKTIGHYKNQSLLVEILLRYLLSVDTNMRLRTINQMFDNNIPRIGDPKEKELIQILFEFDMNHLEKGIRLFLNKFNAWSKTAVSTVEVRGIEVGGMSLAAPFDGKHWVDVNRRACSISFYGDSHSLVWNYFEIMKSTVESLSRSFNFTVRIDLNSKLVVNYCVDEEYHNRFEDIRSVAIAFQSHRAVEEFIQIINPILMNDGTHNEAEESQENFDLNASNTTLNMSILSRSIHNGDLDGRFSFMGNETDAGDSDGDQRRPSLEIAKGVTRSSGVLINEPTVAAPPIKRTKRGLYSHIQHELMEVSTQSTSQESLVIVVDEEDLPQKKKRCSVPSPNNHLTQAIHRPTTSRIYKTSAEERVPIYRTILNDWNSDADSSSYTFVNQDPPGVVPAMRQPGRRNFNATVRKTAPAKKPRATLRRRSSIVVRKTAVAKRKIPLDFVRKIIKRPCKEAAQEAKRIFGLQTTPPYHGHAENVAAEESSVRPADDSTFTATNNEVSRVGSDRVDQTLVGNDTTMLGFYTERRDEVAADVTPPADPESYAVFMKFIEEYRTLSMQMGDVMQGIRKLKTRIISSARLSEYQKAGLLVELCNFLLKR